MISKAMEAKGETSADSEWGKVFPCLPRHRKTLVYHCSTILCHYCMYIFDHHACGNSEFTEEHRGRYINKLLPLYKASLKGDWETASKIIVEDRDIVHAIITRGSQTVLHVAAGAGHDHFVEQLVKFYLRGDDLKVPDAKGNTAFCFAVAAGNMSMAKLMIDTNGTLPQISGGEGMSPLYMAALFGHEEMAFYLYPQFKEKVTNDIRERDGIFFTCIKNDLYGKCFLLLLFFTMMLSPLVVSDI